ncbi:hypothetical protein [Actinoplanes sp. RD1]|uniref:hypothetical protein n=1 Tax=Actinoplanes sp. RD1 TaxID=3064538 RepID=UPI002740CAB8|nr:hypothetical protein [Actinoplanes sp. RD1]
MTTLTASMIAAGSLSCEGGPDDDPGPSKDNYVCTLQSDSLEEKYTAHGLSFRAGGTSTRTAAVAVDPRTKQRAYTATLIYELEGGRNAAVKLTGTMSKWVGSLAPSAEAAILGTAGLGFTYDRPSRRDAEKILGERTPPDRWNRMIVVLGLRGAGEAKALKGDLASKLTVDAQAKGYLTVFPDGRFSVARSLGAQLHTKGPSWLLKRLGVRGQGVSTTWTGRLAIAYELLFDPGGRPVRLTASADVQHGKRLDHTSRVLNLRKERNRADVSGRLSKVLADPFQALTPDEIFFPRRGGKLWSRLNKAETTVGATYEVTAATKDYPLDVGPFGLGYRSEQSTRKLVASHVRMGGREQAFTCGGEANLPEPPKKARKYRSLPPDEVPPPSPVVTTAPTPSPSVSFSEPPPATTDPTAPPTAGPDDPGDPVPEPTEAPLPPEPAEVGF